MSEMDNGHAKGTYSSWTIENETVAVKQCDKSVFQHHGSAIPREIYWFFDVDTLKAGTRRSIILIYDDKEYEAYIKREKHELGRIQIIWSKDLGVKFEEYKEPGNYPRLKFEKVGKDQYAVFFLDDIKLKKKAIEVAEALLKLIVNGQTRITYSELSSMTESKPSAFYEMRYLLEAINKRCYSLGLPSISAMVVNKSTGLPGEGFKQLCVDSFGYDPSLSTEEIMGAELDKIWNCDSWSKLADSLGIEMPRDDNKLPEEMDEVEGETIIEGAKRTIIVNSYERDPRAKKKCTEFYLKRDGRITCQICGFDFGKVYGSEYDNMIHVHHIIPVSEIGEQYVVDPIKDLIPVCPNCHMVLHAGTETSVEELRERLRKIKNHEKN